MTSLQIPLSIIIAGVLISGAVVFSNDGISSRAPQGGSANAGAVAEGHGAFENSNSAIAKNVRQVDFESDHILGGEEAKVVIIEYSDFECPFCSRLHPTLESIVNDFGGEVAWVYRHFPLTSIHSRATGAAIASECVNEIAGNDAFWDFTHEIFINQRSLGNDVYERIATELGISESEFSECISSNRHDSRIDADVENAIASGGRGTPYSIVINQNGDAFPFSGALPYENIRSIVDAALED